MRVLFLLSAVLARDDMKYFEQSSDLVEAEMKGLVSDLPLEHEDVKKASLAEAKARAGAEAEFLDDIFGEDDLGKGLGLGGIGAGVLLIVVCIIVCICRKKGKCGGKKGSAASGEKKGGCCGLSKCVPCPCCKKGVSKDELATTGDGGSDGTAESAGTETGAERGCCGAKTVKKGCMKKQFSVKCCGLFVLLSAIVAGAMFAINFLLGEDGGLEAFLASLPLIGEPLFANGGILADITGSESEYLSVILFAMTAVGCLFILTCIPGCKKLHNMCCGCCISFLVVTVIVCVIEKYAMGGIGKMEEELSDLPLIGLFAKNGGPIGKFIGIGDASNQAAVTMNFCFNLTACLVLLGYCCTMLKKPVFLVKLQKKFSKKGAATTVAEEAADPTGAALVEEDATTALANKAEADAKNVTKCKAGAACCKSCLVLFAIILASIFVFDTLLGDQGGFQNLLGAIPGVGPVLFKDGGELYKLLDGLPIGGEEGIGGDFKNLFANLQLACIILILCLLCQVIGAKYKSCKYCFRCCCNFAILVGVLMAVIILVDGILAKAGGDDTVAKAMRAIPGFGELETILGEQLDLGESESGSGATLVFILAMAFVVVALCACCYGLNQRRKAKKASKLAAAEEAKLEKGDSGCCATMAKATGKAVGCLTCCCKRKTKPESEANVAKEVVAAEESGESPEELAVVDAPPPPPSDSSDTADPAEDPIVDPEDPIVDPEASTVTTPAEPVPPAAVETAVPVVVEQGEEAELEAAAKGNTAGAAALVADVGAVEEAAAKADPSDPASEAALLTAEKELEKEIKIVAPDVTKETPTPEVVEVPSETSGGSADSGSSVEHPPARVGGPSVRDVVVNESANGDFKVQMKFTPK